MKASCIGIPRRRNIGLSHRFTRLHRYWLALGSVGATGMCPEKLPLCLSGHIQQSVEIILPREQRAQRRIMLAV